MITDSLCKLISIFQCEYDQVELDIAVLRAQFNGTANHINTKTNQSTELIQHTYGGGGGGGETRVCFAKTEKIFPPKEPCFPPKMLYVLKL